MKTRYYIFNTYTHNDYDSERINRLIKVENELTFDGFESETDAETWILNHGMRNTEYVILKVLKPTT